MPPNPLIVMVASCNPAKLRATEATFSAGLRRPVSVIPVNTDSGVSPTPRSDDEAILGCRNRLSQCRSRHSGANFLVAMEGLVELGPRGAFVYGWSLVEDLKNGREGLGCSAKVMLPPGIVKLISSGDSLSEVVARHYGIRPISAVADVGTNGIITRGLFSRDDEFESALRAAIGYVLNPKNFVL